MKYSKHRRIIMLVSVFAFLVIGIIGTIFCFAKNTNSIDRITESSKYDDSYYEQLMNDSFDLNGTDVGFLLYEYDGNAKEATLVGFNEKSGNDYITLYRKFLEIPSVIDNAGVNYTVTKIDFDHTLYANTSNVHQKIAHYITGIKIPKSVEYISENAFAAFGSLEYLETPFIGTERGSSAWYLNNVEDENHVIKKSKSLVSMFDKDGLDEGFFVGYNEDGSEKSTIYQAQPQSYQTVRWYENVVTNVKHYKLPIDLTKLVITDDYSFGNHAVWDVSSLVHLEVSVNSDYVENNSVVLGTSVFADNVNLEDIKLPITRNITFNYAEGMLRGNTKLKEARLPGALYVPESCFAQDLNLEKVFLPSDIQEIGDSAFSDCQSLEYISFYAVDTYDPNSLISLNKAGTIDFTTTLKEIGARAFTNCQKFKMVTVPTSVTFIGAYAFSGCNSITNITLPFIGAHRASLDNLNHEQPISTYTSKSGYEYRNCFGYIFTTSSQSNSYAASELYNADNAQTFFIPESLVSITIRDENAVCYGALQNLKSVKYLILNSNIVRIDDGCLNGMSGLEDMEIPFVGTRLGTVFGTSMFADNEAYAAENYYIPNHLSRVKITKQNTISSGCFKNVTSIETVIIGNYTQYVETSVFENNPNLTNLTLPFVGRQRGYFGDTYRWPTWWWYKDVQIRDSLEWAFSPTPSDGAYANNSLYYSVSAYYTRYIPTTLEKVEITDDTYITTNAFENQIYIKELIISGAIHIDEGALKGMNRLHTLSVPYIGYESNPSTLNGKNRVLGHIFGQYDTACLNSYETMYGFHIPNSLSVVNITGGNTGVPKGAFQNCRALITIEFVNTVIRKIDEAAFMDCVNLQNIYMQGKEFTTVGDYAFCNDIKLFDYSAIVPAEQVTKVGDYSFYGTSVGGYQHPIDFSRLSYIGDYAFGNCVELSSVSLSPSNTHIGEGAFSGCQALTDVTIAGKVSKYMFENCYLLEKINFNIDGAKINNIPEGIFKNCISLRFAPVNSDDGFVISNQTTSIGDYAFYGCTSLASFSIPTTCGTIGDYTFSRCTGLSYMKIPNETTTIGVHSWDGCDSNFYFRVYRGEDNWPSSWSPNWNCGYPVYVIEGVIDNIFTYEYDLDYRAYFITGVEEGVELTGQVILPSRHDGLDVIGVTNKNSSNPIFSHTGITSVVIPKTMFYLASHMQGSIVDVGAFETGRRVDLYFEATPEEIARYRASYNPSGTYTKGWITGNTDFDESLGAPSAYESGLISYGLIFYGDSWEYINITSASKTPAIKASSLYMDFEFSNQQYTGYQIKAENLLQVVYTKAVLVGDAHLDKYVGFIDPNMFLSGYDYTEMFTTTYANNINAGEATIYSNLIKSYYDAYINELGNYPLYITGTNVYHFDIEKVSIDLYASQRRSQYVINSAVYNGSPWSNDNWEGLILGLDVFGAEFSGKLGTNSANADEYESDIQSGGLGEFVWLEPFKVYKVNSNKEKVDITHNFQIKLNLKVVINPMRVTIKWIDDTPEDHSTIKNGVEFFEYRYNGSTIVQPRAVAVRVDYDYLSTIDDVAHNSTFTDEVVSSCGIIVRNDFNYTSADIWNFLTPNDERFHTAYAYLDSNSNGNYVLVYPKSSSNAGKKVGENAYTTHFAPNDSYQALSAEYRIIKGLVTIDINYTGSNAYEIGTNENYWEVNFNGENQHDDIEAGILSGIGSDTIFLGNFRTWDVGDDEENFIKINNETIRLGDKQQVYNYQNEGIHAVQTLVQYYDSNNNLITLNASQANTPYHFYRYFDGVPYSEDEYYELYVKDFRVEIKYSDFELQYYIIKVDKIYDTYVDIEGELPIRVYPSPVSETYTDNNVTKTRIVQRLNYAVDGNYYLMYVDVSNSDEISEFSQHYFTENGEGNEFKGLYFRNANEEYFFSSTVAGRHYNQQIIPIRLITEKSNVEFMSSLDKEYDRNPYDIANFVTKRDVVSNPNQTITALYFPRNIIETDYVKYGYSTVEAFLASIYADEFKTTVGPTDVGQYAAVISAPETDYFNGIEDEIVYFNVIKKKIYIDVSGYGCRFAEGNLGDSRKYNAQVQTFTPTTESLSVLGYLLPDVYENEVLVVGKDIFSGILRTRSSEPGTYSALNPNDFVWDTNFKVVSSLDVDNTSNYQVVLTGEYKILKLDFGVVEHNVGHEEEFIFDGTTKYAYVEPVFDEAYPEMTNYTIYYSLNTINPLRLDLCSQNLAPYFSLPTSGEIPVYYYIVGDNYNPKSGTLYVNIKPKTIKYRLPEGVVDTGGNYKQYVIPYDNQYHEFEVYKEEPYYATIYYGTGDGEWTTTPFMLREVNVNNPLTIYFKIEAEYYETYYGGPILFTITDEAFSDFDTDYYRAEDTEIVYNGQYHTIKFFNGDDGPHAAADLEYSLDGTNWTTDISEVSFKNVGTYRVYIKFYLPYYKSLIVNKVLTITKRTFTGLNIESKIGRNAIIYDGQYHTLDVYGTPLSYEDVEEHDPITDDITVVRYYYYTDPVTDIKESITILYDKNSWVTYRSPEKIYYKDANSATTLYRIYAFIYNPNYETLMLGDGETVGVMLIKMAEGSASYSFKQIEYTKTNFDSASLGIQTIHDGSKIYRYWAAYYDGNEKKCDFTTRVADPRELGLYCFTVTYSGSRNVKDFVLGASNNNDETLLVFFEIVPKTLKVQYFDELYYDGLEHDPNPTVTTGTTDNLIIDYTLTKTVIGGVEDNDPNQSLRPVEVGEYTYSLSIHGGNTNYVLDKYEITMSIVKRKVDISITDSKVYDGKIYAKSNFQTSDLSGETIFEYTDWRSFAGLLPQHKVLLSLKTSRTAITSYTGEYGVNSYATNAVIVAYFDIVLMEPRMDNENYVRDSDGNIIYDYVLDNGNYVSVLQFYDVEGEFIIKITKQTFDIGACSEVIEYDGYDHTLKIFDSRNYVGDLSYLAGASISVIEYDSEGEPYIVNPTKYRNVGVYEYTILVVKSGYENSIDTVTLTILPATLDVSILSLEEIADGYQIYDDIEKTTSYNVATINPEELPIFTQYTSDISAGSVRYYKASQYSLLQISTFYNDFNANNEIFKNSLKTIKEAGDYYCVVYYAKNDYKWYKSVTIYKVTIEQRELHVILSDKTSETHTKSYDGKRIVISLGGFVEGWSNTLKKYTFVTNDLVQGHSIDDSIEKMSNYSVRTVSANAGTYTAPVGFEFNYMEILNASGENVAYNYKPIMTDNVKAIINKAFLTEELFDVRGIDKYYDLDYAKPIVVTPSDGLVEYKYQIYTDYENKIYDSQLYAGLPKNVGNYRVYVSILDGTNYYGSSAVNNFSVALGDQIVDVIIRQAPISVNWGNLSVSFNGSIQSRTAYVVESDGNIVYLNVYYYETANDIVEGYVAAGTYLSYAEFASGIVGNPATFNLEQYQKNYKLSNETELFTINSIAYYLNIGSRTVKMPKDTVWSGSFDESMISGFPTNIVRLVGNKALTPQISTAFATAGTYNTSNMFNLDYSIININPELDVTDSIRLYVVGSVVIESNVVPVSTTNKTLVYQYGGYSFKALNAITVSGTIASSCTILYMYSPDYYSPVEQTYDDFRLEDVGIYEIEAIISCDGYDNAYVTVKIEIKPKDAFVTFVDTLTKDYDGIQISASNLISNDTNHYGFNSIYQGLVYTYFQYTDGQNSVQLNGAPIDAGNYYVVVTCLEDKFNSNDLQNYTVLNKQMDFQIRPRKISLVFDLDETLVLSSVGTSWSKTWDYSSGNLIGQLPSVDFLKITVSIPRIARTTYSANVVLDDKKRPEVLDSPFVGTHEELPLPDSYLQTTFTTTTTVDTILDEDKIWSVKWLIYRAQDGAEELYDVTGNYDITIDFDAYFHLKLIQGYTVIGVGEAANQPVQAYTGTKYNGRIDVADGATTGVRYEFATDTSYFGTTSSVDDITNPAVQFSLPGRYRVYYRFTAGDEYEPFTGSYYIDIQKISSPFYITDDLTKKYDGTSLYEDYLNIGTVLPHLSYKDNNNLEQLFINNGVFRFLTDKSELIDDVVDINAITVTYTYGSLILNGKAGSEPINAGTYLVTIKIPETQYCKQTTITQNISIEKRTILISNKNETSANHIYNKGVGVFADFSSTNVYYNIFYINDDDTRTNITNLEKYSLTGTIVTSGIGAGTYLGSNSNSYFVKWNGTPTFSVDGDESVSSNYSISLNEVSYVIYKAQQTVYDLTPSYTYDGDYHTIVIQRSQTSVLECQDPNTQEWIELGDDLNHRFSFVDANTTGYVVNWRTRETNYDDFYATTTIIIRPEQTYVNILTALGKEYNGEEVLIPESIETNSTLKDSKSYIYTYYQKVQRNGQDDWMMLSSFRWDSNLGKFVTTEEYMEVKRPVNVGEYLVTVDVPAASNYEAGIGELEFQITAKGLDIIWGDDVLFYNGLPQSVKAYAHLVDETIELDTTVTPFISGDETHKAVGTYLSEADISVIPSNYEVTLSTRQKRFIINPKKLVITLNRNVTYTGAEREFDIYDEVENPGGYQVESLCKNSQYNVEHVIYGKLTLSKIAVRTASYKQFGSTKDFYWAENGQSPDKCIILDEHGISVEDNYNVIYNLNVTINYNNINISITGSEGFEDVSESNWTYIYEPEEERYITVTVLNSNPDDYVVLYSTSETGVYSSNLIKYIDVAGTVEEPGCYPIYYRVYKIGDVGSYQLAQAYQENQPYYNITEVTLTQQTFVANQYYRYSNVNARYELAINYIANETYYSIAQAVGITSQTFQPNTYYIAMDGGYPPVTGSATITIIPKNAQLSFENPLRDLSKTYDGLGVINQNHPVVCEDQTATFTYKYYKYDEEAENNKGEFVETIQNYGPVDAGKYVLEVSVIGGSNNYMTNPIYHVFEIYKRDVIVRVGPVKKVFDYYIWSKDITNADVFMYNEKNGILIDGIASGQTFVGKLETKAYVVGKYTNFATSFRWNNPYNTEYGYIIYGATIDDDVTHNYNISYDLSVEITKAPISVIVTCKNLTYDGEAHHIDVEVVDSKRLVNNENLTYPKPLVYQIYYSTDGENWDTKNPEFMKTGFHPVYVRIEADNYNTLEFTNGSLVVNPDGNQVNIESYVRIEGVTFSGGSLDYAGKVEATNYYYCGIPYPTPYYVDSPSSGAQSVKYYTEETYRAYRIAYENQSPVTKEEIDAIKAQYLTPYEIAASNVIDAGKYHFVLTIASDGIYDDEEFNASFEIYKREVTINWKKTVDGVTYDTLTMEYTGENLTPEATFTRIDSTVVPLTVTLTKDLQTNAAVFDHKNVGRYEVEASFASELDAKNYKLINPKDVFTITKLNVDDLLIPDDLTVIFGDELVLVDTSGNILLLDSEGYLVYLVESPYVIFTDGDGDTSVGILNDDETYSNVKKIILADNTLADGISRYQYYIVVDSDTSVGTHNIEVVLDNPDDYMWRGQKNSSPLIYTYKVTEITVPDGSQRFTLSISLDKSTMVIGEEKPVPIVKITDTSTGTETTLVMGTDFTATYINEDNWEQLIAESSEGKITAEVRIMGQGNYSIAASKNFFVIDKEPELLKIVEDAPIQFIKVKYDDEKIYYQEDSNILEERTTSNYNGPDADGYEYYLGHIHQETKILDLLHLFGNSPNNIKVFTRNDFTTVDDDDETKLKFEIPSDKYDKEIVGTGYYIVLYNEGKIIDSIECIVFGDLDGDGNINPNDINVIKQYMTGGVELDMAQPYVSSENKIKLSQLIAGIISRDVHTTVNADAINWIKKYLVVDSEDESALREADFNYDYII